MANMVLDTTGINFIKNNEGIIKNSAGLAVAYNDGYGTLTIGYGHTEGVHSGQTMTVAQAVALLPADINGKYGKCVNMYIKQKMTQNQFDAMVDLCYNIGISNDPKHPGFPQSQVCKLFNNGDIKGASNAFRGWEKPASLASRREREIKLFNTAPTTAQKTSTPAKNNANTNAVNDAKKKIADKKASDALIAKNKANDIAKAKAIQASDALKKAKLTKNSATIAKAQNDVNKLKVNPTKTSIVKTPVQKTILKSGFGVLGLIAMIITFKYGYDL
jgi:lysozyme